MSLTSVTKPDDGAEGAPTHPAAKREVLHVEGETSSMDAADQLRLVVGRSETPIQSGSAGVLSVIGLDERTRIMTTDLVPYVLICALEIESPWGMFVGTGWYIGRKTLITAGHCVYHRTQMGGWATRITVTPGASSGSQAPRGTTRATRFSTTDTWLADLNPDYDVAAIHLDDDLLPAGAAPFRVASLPDAELTNMLINVSGYPADKGGKQQWWARNRVRSLRPRRIFYDVDTMGGQSGAPAFILEKAGDTPLVVGVHAYGTGGTPSDLPLEVNSAPRITSDVLALFKQWVDQDTPGAAVRS